MFESSGTPGVLLCTKGREWEICLNVNFSEIACLCKMPKFLFKNSKNILHDGLSFYLNSTLLGKYCTFSKRSSNKTLSQRLVWADTLDSPRGFDAKTKAVALEIPPATQASGIQTNKGELSVISRNRRLSLITHTQT